jgi:hypothetical protein
MTRDADGALPVRYRGNSCPVTRPELIPGEEFEAAINLVLRKEFGLGPISLVSSTIRLMGFKRSGTNLQEAVEVALRRLMDHGDVVVDTAGFLVLAQKA